MAGAKNREITRPFFKFLEPQYAKTMLERGNMRIGTLHEYTNEEKYSGGTLDKYEGTKKISFRCKGNTYYRGGILVKNRVLEQEAQDCHIYCTTEVPTIKNIRRNYEEERTECVAIVNPSLFISSLKERAKKEKSLAQYQGNFKCKYDGRHYHLPLSEEATSRKDIEDIIGLHPGMLKEPSHSWQREYRMVWDDEKRNGKLEPVCFHRVPEADKACVPLTVDGRISDPKGEIPANGKVRLASYWKSGGWIGVERPIKYGLMRPIVVTYEGQQYACAHCGLDYKDADWVSSQGRYHHKRRDMPSGDVVAIDSSAPLANGTRYFGLAPLNQIERLGYSITDTDS